MERWCPDRAFGCVQGRCRVHRAELLRLSGPADVAERVALQACAELRPWMRREFGWPMVELGTIRLRRGDLAGAEEAFAAAGDHGWSPHPSLALLRLEQGDVAAAKDLITAAIAHPAEAPSKEQPPFGDLRLAPLLDAQAEICAVAGDGPALATAAEALAGVAQRYASPALQAAAALASARVAVIDGEGAVAVARARAAEEAFDALDAGYDVGRARTVVAEGLELTGDRVGAVAELRAAQRAYATYGAKHRAAALDARVEGTAPAHRPTEDRARRGVFRADGPMWQIELEGLRIGRRRGGAGGDRRCRPGGLPTPPARRRRRHRGGRAAQRPGTAGQGRGRPRLPRRRAQPCRWPRRAWSHGGRVVRTGPHERGAVAPLRPGRGRVPPPAGGRRPSTFGRVCAPAPTARTSPTRSPGWTGSSDPRGT